MPCRHRSPFPPPRLAETRRQERRGRALRGLCRRLSVSMIARVMRRSVTAGVMGLSVGVMGRSVTAGVMGRSVTAGAMGLSVTAGVMVIMEPSHFSGCSREGSISDSP